jgi:hypothetical protein
MYIFLADSRTNGFVKWAGAHQPEKLGDARGVAGVIEIWAPAEQPHRPWLVPGW